MLHFARLALLLLITAPLVAQTSSLTVTITDENSVAVAAAIVQLQGPVSQRLESDFAGRCRFTAPFGSYRLTINKDGFYAVTLHDINLPDVDHLDVTLAHTQEVKENLDVVASAPQIDPAQIANTESLDAHEIVNVPYPTTRDIRQALSFIPGVVRGPAGQVHVSGGEAWENLDLLDGFNIGHPVTGTLDVRFSADAVRQIDIQQGRYSAEFGKSSAGVVSFVTAMGDDRWRYSATNFIPSVQSKKGIGLDKWTPRATFSGPIVKGRAWFLLAPDAEYDTNVFKDLPDGADRNPLWRISNLARLQVNLTSNNILTGSFLVNRFHQSYAGLSLFNPQEATTNLDRTSYFASFKDQHYFPGGMLLEVGAAVLHFRDESLPLGTAMYFITPESSRGNFYRTTTTSARRVQAISNLFLPPQRLAGRHDLKLGIDIDRIDDTQNSLRRPISILRENGTLAGRIVFSAPANFSQDNVEYGAYIQDRWSPNDRLLVQSGIRFDRDTFIGSSAFSPRVGASYMLTSDALTKLTFGVGLFHDATNLGLVTRPLAGPRQQFLFANDGVTPVGSPLSTTFTVNRRALELPGFLNWSFGIERRLPAAIYLNAEFVQRRGNNNFVYRNLSSAPFAGNYLLANNRHDTYRAFQLSARRVFHEDHEIMFAYTRSRARTDAVLDFSPDNIVFGTQAPGPLPWDSPNHLVGWGFLPMPWRKKWSIAYSLDWHTGLPFSVVDQNQQIVGAPNSFRFPDYFSLNFFLERRFSFRGYNLALRGGFEDITGHDNPFVVNNNIDSPHFLEFQNVGRRSFVARIRFLGRK